MKSVRLILRRFRAFFHRDQLDAEMSEEIRSHLELQEKENLAAGMPPAEARYAALRSFGGVEQVKERAREQRSWVLGEQVTQDIRYGLRSLYQRPGFATVAILIFALGIGATTAAFTTMNVLLLTPLPVRAPDELVLANQRNASGSRQTDRFNFPFYTRLVTESDALRDMAAVSYANRTLSETDRIGTVPEIVRSGEVTGNFFPVLGVPMLLGRGLGLDDDRTGDPQAVIVLGYDFWVRRFGGDPGVLGQTVRLDNVPLTVVGVSAPGFAGIEVGGIMDVWLPLQMLRRLQPDGGTQFTRDTIAWLKLIGRLPPSLSRTAGTAELNLIYHRYVDGVAEALGAGWAKSGQRRALEGQVELLAGKTGFNPAFSFIKPLLTGLGMIVGLVLFLACANVASLLLARASSREREFAVRLALGCSRARLIRQVMTETLLLAAAGGICGTFLARWGLDVLVRSFFPPEILQLTGLHLSVDLRVLGFAIVCVGVTGLVVGLIPATRSSRVDLVPALKSQGESGFRGRHLRLNRVLVSGQLAISVCLLVMTGLFARTVQKLRAVDLGYRQENILRIPVVTDRALDPSRRADLAFKILDSVAALPAVERITLAELRMTRARIAIDEYAPPTGEDMVVPVAYAGPGFFETYAIPALRGRTLTAEEALRRDSLPAANEVAVAVVTESFAKAYFGGRDPIGQVFRQVAPATVFRIVGVVRDVSFYGPRVSTPRMIFLPYSFQIGSQPALVFAIAGKTDVVALAGDLQAAIRQAAPQAAIRSPLFTEATMTENQLIQERAIARVAGFFSGLGLLLASVGLYGVLAYDVSRRTREIGVRIALGANPLDVQRLFVGKGLRLAVIGAVCGLVVASGFSRLVTRLLYDISPADPETLISTTVILLIVSLIACWLPARRATKVDPMIALRAE